MNKEMKMSDVSSQLRMMAKGRFANDDLVSADRLAKIAIEHDRLVEELQAKTDMMAVMVEEKSRLTEENAELRELVKTYRLASDEAAKCKYALSRNESHTGEPEGELKSNLSESDVILCIAKQLLNK